MKVLILGAGVIGVSAAYALAARGHEVEVLERQSAAGSETSFANGGQLSFSHAEPWANPAVLKHVFAWMFQKDAPLVLRFGFDLHQMRWILSFLRNCSAARSHQNAAHLLRLGLYSKQAMAGIREASGVEFDHLARGIIHVYSDPKAFAHAVKEAEFQNHAAGGVRSMEVMSPAQMLEKEPALLHTVRPIVGGIFCEQDESGDACSFTRNLAAISTQNLGVNYQFGTHIKHLLVDKGQIAGVQSDKGIHTADAYVMALGSYSYVYLKQVGISVPVYPLKGYSVTMPAGESDPFVSVTDNEHKVVISRLGNRLRAAGTAEFAGYNSALDEGRICPILAAARLLFPHADYSPDTIEKWACLRPATPSGLPILGRTRYDNLYLNIGHGTLGWTQSAGSAMLLADILENRPTDIPLTGLTL